LLQKQISEASLKQKVMERWFNWDENPIKSCTEGIQITTQPFLFHLKEDSSQKVSFISF